MPKKCSLLQNTVKQTFSSQHFAKYLKFATQFGSRRWSHQIIEVGATVKNDP